MGLRDSDLQVACVLISCAERAQMRERTLENLAGTDWGARPVHAQIDRKATDDRLLNIVDTAFLALEHGLKTNAPHVLLLEDDLDFNLHFCRNLAAWWPFKTGKITLASLFNPGVWSVFVDPPNHCFEAHPHHVFGSQALVLSRQTIEYVLGHWAEIAAPLDIRTSRLAARLQRPLYYHIPSLVQHLGHQSVWGGRFHDAVDFDRDWRAGPGP